MTQVVQLKVRDVASKGFVQAVERLAESRGYSSLSDHAAVIRLAKAVTGTIKDLKTLAESDADINTKLDEMVSMEGCLLSDRVVTEARLSPADCLAIEELFQKGK